MEGGFSPAGRPFFLAKYKPRSMYAKSLGHQVHSSPQLETVTALNEMFDARLCPHVGIALEFQYGLRAALRVQKS
jgi:hypothetical protein